MNHDGNIDLIASNESGSGVGIWLGDGIGDFDPEISTGGTIRKGGVEVADINNDGNIDIASCYYQPSGGTEDKVYVWLGDGNGGWGSDIGPPIDMGFDDVALGDVDHNGTIDLFATTHMRGVRFWKGDGNGGWTLQPQNGLPFTSSPPWVGGLGACFGDVNHDGDLDIAIGGYNGNYGMRVYLGDGGEGGEVDWTNASLGLPTIGQYAGIELGDINNDGHLDVLSANNQGATGNGIGLYLGNGGEGGSMFWTDSLLPALPSSGYYWGVDFGDVNNDGVLDIAITNNNGIEVYITQVKPYYQIVLSEGWNLISLPLIQSDTSIEEVFTSIDGEYNAIRCYNSSDINDPWKHLHTSKPSSMNDLKDVNHTRGIWIYITKPGGTTLTIYGDEIITGQSITLKPGWNLVGYPSLTSYNRTDGLNNTDFGTDINAIWSYDAETKQWKEMEESDYFELSRGYWIHSKKESEIIWEVPL